MEYTQFFEVKIFSPKEAKNQVSIDATKYISKNITISDEDGLIKECSFDMDDGYLMLDILTIGMRVEVTSGDLTTNRVSFLGYIKVIEPNFQDNGEVSLRISCHSVEGGKLGVEVKDIIFPSTTNKKGWATKEIMYSDIITHIAKDSGILVKSENIHVIKDIKATLSGGIHQRNKTDWAFIQELSARIGCTVWTEEISGQTYLHLRDDRNLVNTIGEVSFFFLPRIGNSEFPEGIRPNTEGQIQFISAKIKLDTSNGVGAFRQRQTKDKKGKPVTQIYTDRPIKNDDGSDNGDTERWVVDEEKLKAMSFEARNELIQLFMSGKVTWEGENGGVAAKNYFIKWTEQTSSREGVPNHTEVSNSDGTKENTGSKSFKTVIDEDKLKGLSAEKRSGIMGRIARGQMTEEDKTYYKTVDTTPKESKDDASVSGNKENTTADKDKKKKKPKTPKVETNDWKRKRDDGFVITAKVYGDLRIRTKQSYIIEGLSKYSGKYYLYKMTENHGSDGWTMDLIFTK